MIDSEKNNTGLWIVVSRYLGAGRGQSITKFKLFNDKKYITLNKLTKSERRCAFRDGEAGHLKLK